MDELTTETPVLAKARSIAGPIGWLTLAAAAVACIVQVKIIGDLGFGWFEDWKTYAHAVDRFLAGGSLYDPLQLSRSYVFPEVVRTGYVYPPPSILLFVPFASQPVGLAAWEIVNLGLLLGGLTAVLRRELGTVAPWPLALTLAGLAAFPPFGMAVSSGQVQVGLTGILAFAWTAHSGDRWLAPAAGVGGVLKVLPGFLAVWAARVSGWRAFVVAAGVAATIGVVTLPVVGLGSWQDFRIAFGNSVPYCWGWHPSIACFVEPAVGTTVAKWIGVAVAAVLLLGVLAIQDRLVAFMLLAAATLAPVTDGHWYYLMTVFVVLHVAICHVVGLRQGRAAASAGG